MKEVLKPDFCVIGGGAGGLAVAAAAARLGVPVVLIEGGRMGGTHLNAGDVPLHALLAAGKRAGAIRGAAAFGIDAAAMKIDPVRVHDHVQGVSAGVAPNDSAARFTGLGVRVIQAEARFIDKDTVEAGDQLIRARRFVVASGASPRIPQIQGLDQVPYLTTETIFGLKEKIGHLIVLGGDPTALEIAQAYRLLGAGVTIIADDAFLATEDLEAARIVLERLVAQDMTLHACTKVVRIERAAKGIAVRLAKDGAADMVRGSHLLCATGRKPNVEALGLEYAGVAYDARGITVNEQLKTTNAHIYAIGDVVGGERSTHLAEHHAWIVIKNALFRLRPKASATAIPRVTYTDPELAQIGLTEAEARQRHGPIRILRWPYAENDRAQAEREAHGFIKVVLKPNGVILGCTIVGAKASELIGLWALVLARKIRIGDLAGLVLPYPTLSELSKRVALTFYWTTPTRGWLRRGIDFLRRFG